MLKNILFAKKHDVVFSDFKYISLPKSDVYFFSGLDFDDNDIGSFIKIISNFKHRFHVISIGMPLDLDHYIKLDEMVISSSWGYTKAYIYLC